MLHNGLTIDRQSPRQPNVIAVEKRHIVAIGVGNSAIAGRRGTGVILSQEARPVTKFGGKWRQILCGSIIDHNHFEVVVFLPEDRLQRLAK